MTESVEELLIANETMYKTIAQLREENKVMRKVIEHISRDEEYTKLAAADLIFVIEAYKFDANMALRQLAKVGKK